MLRIKFQIEAGWLQKLKELVSRTKQHPIFYYRPVYVLEYGVKSKSIIREFFKNGRIRNN